MQPVQDCLCRAVLFQGFVVTSILDAYHNNNKSFRSFKSKENIHKKEVGHCFGY